MPTSPTYHLPPTVPLPSHSPPLLNTTCSTCHAHRAAHLQATRAQEKVTANNHAIETAVNTQGASYSTLPHPLLPHPIPSRPIPSHPVPSHPILSHLILPSTSRPIPVHPLAPLGTPPLPLQHTLPFYHRVDLPPCLLASLLPRRPAAQPL